MIASLLSNVKDVVSMIIKYKGTGFLLVLYVAAVIFLLIKEKDMRKKLLLVYAPLLMIVLILCPIYYRLYMGYLDDAGTYYRMMWLLPISVTIATAGCKILVLASDRFGSKGRWISACIFSAILMLCGRFTYAAVESTRAENAYHIPQYVIELCDEMPEYIPGVQIYACVPLEMLFYVRQYNSRICLAYGREAVEPVWGYYNPYYELYELAEVLDWDAILTMTRDTSLNGSMIPTYYVTPEDREMTVEPGECGLVEVKRAGGYVLYRDTIAVEMNREMFKDLKLE